MKQWTLQSTLPGYFECPELLDLPVDGDRDDVRWIVLAADAQYAIGHFDGKKFTPQHEGKHRLHYGDYYASQIFSNAPGGRRIQIGWARITMPGMPFNQTFSFPHELSLRTTTDGVRLFAEPVKEIQQIHRKRYFTENQALTTEQAATLDVQGELFDIRATFEVGQARSLGIDIGGEQVLYDVKSNTLSGAALKPVDGQLTIRILVDRPMLEIIGNRGRVYITKPRQVKGDVSRITALAQGGEAKLQSLEVFQLESIWHQ
jgi:fructan beta-fructosidase